MPTWQAGPWRIVGADGIPGTGRTAQQNKHKGAKASTLIRPLHNPDKQTRSHPPFLFNTQQDKLSYENGSWETVSTSLVWSFTTEPQIYSRQWR
jgi:hypothetical protein